MSCLWKSVLKYDFLRRYLMFFNSLRDILYLVDRKLSLQWMTAIRQLSFVFGCSLQWMTAIRQLS